MSINNINMMNGIVSDGCINKIGMYDNDRYIKNDKNSMEALL